MERNYAARATSAISKSLTSPQIFLSFAALFWAGNFIVGRGLRGEIAPLSLNFWRWTIAMTILVLLSFAQLRQHRAVLLQEWKLILALGASGVAAFHTFVYLALTTTPAVNALLILSTTPIAIAVISWLAFRDTTTVRQAAGMLVSLVGALVVITHGNIATFSSFQFDPGDLWMLGAVPIWAIYSVLLKRRPEALPQLVLLTASAVAGLALLLPVYLWQIGHGETMVVNATTVASVLYIAVFSSVVAFLAWNRGVSTIGPTKAGLFLQLMPVFGAILAVVFLSEPIALYHALGAVLVLGGIAFASQSHVGAQTPTCHPC